MSKNKKILMMLAKGGVSQSDIAAALHVSKRDVSAGAKVVRECGLTFDAISSMDADVVDDLFFPREERRQNGAYLQLDMEPLVERKKKNRKLPVKLFWIEYCERAAADDKLAYAYQTFCEMFAEAAEKMDGYKSVELLIVDDFMTTPVTTQNSIDLFEIMEAREGRRATIIASQLEPNEWYLRIEGELMADSILNRIATGARYIDLEGPNMREYLAKRKEAV